MSTFSFPDLMKPETMIKAIPDASVWMKAVPVMPVPPLMIHPVAASAAVATIGVGIAAQMMGAFAGSLQGVVEVSRKYGLPAADAVLGHPLSTAELDRTQARRPAAAGPAAVRSAARKTAKAPTTAKAEAAAKSPVADRADVAMSGLKAAADTAAHAVMETREAAAPTKEPEGERELAPEDYKRPAERAKPERPDDLKQISGIGPKLEQVLNSLGIWTFEQVAGWTKEEMSWLDDYLQFRGRIERDTWQEQAAKFAKAAK